MDLNQDLQDFLNDKMSFEDLLARHFLSYEVEEIKAWESIYKSKRRRPHIDDAPINVRLYFIAARNFHRDPEDIKTYEKAVEAYDELSREQQGEYFGFIAYENWTLDVANGWLPELVNEMIFPEKLAQFEAIKRVVHGEEEEEPERAEAHDLQKRLERLRERGSL